MIAKDGRTYAQLRDGEVVWLFTGKELAAWNERVLEVLDVTDLDAGVGWKVVGGKPVPPTTAVTLKDMEASVQRMLDNAARELGYDSIATAVSYANEPAVAAYAAEGKKLRAWRSKVWQAFYTQVEANGGDVSKLDLSTLPTPTP